MSNCLVALEKEIAGKTSSAETDTVNARLSTASNAIQRRLSLDSSSKRGCLVIRVGKEAKEQNIHLFLV